MPWWFWATLWNINVCCFVTFAASIDCHRELAHVKTLKLNEQLNTKYWTLDTKSYHLVNTKQLKSNLQKWKVGQRARFESRWPDDAPISFFLCISRGSKNECSHSIGIKSLFARLEFVNKIILYFFLHEKIKLIWFKTLTLM